MKKDIHPKYEKVVIKCACGNEIETRSTHGSEIHVELCSVCHPFYTGKQKFVDTAGRVDKFRARLEAAKTKKETSSKKDKSEKAEKTNKEKLEEIKKDLGAPGEITQEVFSDEELAAADEIADNFAGHKEEQNQ